MPSTRKSYSKTYLNLKAFPDDGFYYFEDKRYCLHDYQLLYAPICQRCQNFVEGEVVKVCSFDDNYHADACCLLCWVAHSQVNWKQKQTLYSSRRTVVDLEMKIRLVFLFGWQLNFWNTIYQWT